MCHKDAHRRTSSKREVSGRTHNSPDWSPFYMPLAHTPRPHAYLATAYPVSDFSSSALERLTCSRASCPLFRSASTLRFAFSSSPRATFSFWSSSWVSCMVLSSLILSLDSLLALSSSFCRLLVSSWGRRLYSGCGQVVMVRVVGKWYQHNAKLFPFMKPPHRAHCSS